MGTGKASLFSSYLNMVNTVLGSGLLAIPSAFARTGWAWGIVLLIVAAALSATTNFYIVEGTKRVEYPATFKSISGAASRRLPIVLDLAVIITCIGAMLAYIIISVDSFTNVTETELRWPWITLAALIVTPLSFLREMSMLSFTSFVALFILAFITLVTMMFAASDADSGTLAECPDLAIGESDGISCPPGETETVGHDVLASLPSIILAFTSQMSTPTIVNELDRPTAPRIFTLIASSVGSALLIYLVTCNL